jgi:hypothetical protein
MNCFDNASLSQFDAAAQTIDKTCPMSGFFPIDAHGNAISLQSPTTCTAMMIG